MQLQVSTISVTKTNHYTTLITETKLFGLFKTLVYNMRVTKYNNKVTYPKEKTDKKQTASVRVSINLPIALFWSWISPAFGWDDDKHTHRLPVSFLVGQTSWLAGLSVLPGKGLDLQEGRESSNSSNWPCRVSSLTIPLSKKISKQG